MEGGKLAEYRSNKIILGNISDKEMLKTFNCGVGFCLIIKKNNFNKITKYFSQKYKPYVIGKICRGKIKVKLNEKLHW